MIANVPLHKLNVPLITKFKNDLIKNTDITALKNVPRYLKQSFTLCGKTGDSCQLSKDVFQKG
jgi:hypothetical protein